MADSGKTQEIPPELHPTLKPLSWLLGKWRSEDGRGQYPTMKDFKYGEEVEFYHLGGPYIQFTFNSWHSETKKPMHREVGFIRVKPNSKEVALMIAQNIGIVEIEEGSVRNLVMTTGSHTIGRMTFGTEPAVKKMCRLFTRTGNELEHVVEMETVNTPLTEHTRITYKKIG